ncbi:MAG: TolC family protein [Pseudomonadota bacterium]
MAVISDGPQLQLQDVGQGILKELKDLTEGEFEIEFIPMEAEWSRESLLAAYDQSYADPRVDLVLALGIAANQLAVSLPAYPKPTFAPIVINPQLLGAPSAGETSGQANLNYLADRVSFRQDFLSFQRVVPFQRAVVLTDALILQSVPDLPDLVRELGAGAQYTFLGHDGVNHRLIDLIPADADAVLLGGLPRLPQAEFDAFLKALISRRLPAFSLISETEVEAGALASDAVRTDFARVARRNALNMQAVMLGERAGDQPIFMEGKRQLTINMETARAIGLSPRFDVLSEAVLLGADQELTGPGLDLVGVTRLALERNLNLAASELDVALGETDVRSARANLLPQLDVAVTGALRRDNPAARFANAERSTAGSLTLSQLIYSEQAAAGYRQQRWLQRAREFGYEATRLDLIRDSAVAYLQVLRAENQLSIQQDNLNLSKSNLELARDRVRVGSSSNADIFRWEADLANARSAVLGAAAGLDQARDALSRLLDQPFNEPLKVIPVEEGAPFVVTTDEFDQLVDSPQRFRWFSELTVSNGLERAPEVLQLDAQIGAAQRDLTARKRAFWLPDFSLQAQYNDSFDASGVGSGTALDTVNDWQVGINVGLPLFAGGALRADLARSKIQLEQLYIQRQATVQIVEQTIRAAFYAATASYNNIDLSEEAARASRENLALVSDAYSQGTVNIIQLLDAQTQSLQADLNANNAVHDFLIDIMELQRASNGFDFLLSATEKDQRAQELRDYLRQRELQSQTSGETVP